MTRKFLVGAIVASALVGCGEPEAKPDPAQARAQAQTARAEKIRAASTGPDLSVCAEAGSRKTYMAGFRAERARLKKARTEADVAHTERVKSIKAQLLASGAWTAEQETAFAEAVLKDPALSYQIKRVVQRGLVEKDAADLYDRLRLYDDAVAACEAAVWLALRMTDADTASAESHRQMQALYVAEAARLKTPLK